MAIVDDIKSSGVMIVVTSKGNYSAVLPQVQAGIANAVGKIGYITINKPINTLIQDLQKLGIDTSKFFFVDAITATVQSPPAIENCIFVNSPSALTDIGLAYTSLFSEKACDLVFFDTISTLMVYEDIGSVIKFVHNLVTKTRVINKKAVFFALKEDSETLIKDLNMFVDKVLEL